MASLGGDQQISSNSPAAEPVQTADSREGSAERKVARDRDEKLKLARERQNEERQRKIEELKAQAEAAQRYREQKDEERRRRIEEIRSRDTEKRHQVEERKRAIMEAEKDRREYILKKNMERESRLETKKRERNSIGFAFGSSTPRLLESADFGMISPSTFWGHRRSTSISNVAGASLTRRSSERELADSGSKKRATSASGTERHDEDNVDTSQIMFRSVARRKTDLMPTITSPRDGHYYGSKSSLSNTPRTPGSRSGNATPGGSISTSRPGSAMSTSTTMSTSGNVARRSVPVRKPRPASIAGTGVSLDEINKLKRENKPPLKTSANNHHSTSAQNTPKRTSNMMSTSLIVTSSSTRLSSAEKKTPAKREPPLTPKASTPKQPLSKTSSSDRLNKLSKEKPKDAVPPSMTKSTIVAPAPSQPSATLNNSSSSNNNAAAVAKADITPAAPAVKSKDEKNALNSVKTEESTLLLVDQTVAEPHVAATAPAVVIGGEEKVDQGNEKDATEAAEVPAVAVVKREQQNDSNGSNQNSEMRELTPPTEGADMMTASMIAAKNKITTEEEAKAALAERRRLAREEAERQAELERQRVEAERLAELQRQEDEAERQRQFEEESTRLAQQQRLAEDERLRLAIEEAKQRDEEERIKREDEERQRVEREEAEKKAKEEAEKQRLEVAERLKREEKEREERRKRVEAIMSRTRKGGAATGTPNSTPAKESNDGADKSTTNDAQTPPQQQQQQQLNAVNSDSSSTSGSTTATTTPTPIPVQATPIAVQEPQNTQAMYEQSVIDKETALINSFSNMIIDENAKNLQQQQQQQPPLQPQIVEVTNGKLHTTEYPNSDDALLQNSTTTTTTTTAIANGNGLIENMNNKNDINILQDVVGPATNQLIDLSIESQDINNAVNFNNNNSLLTNTTTATLVTADSHENKDISLL